MRIELVIDELALVGFNPLDRSAIGDAVQAELTRLLSNHDAISANDIAAAVQHARTSHIERVNAGSTTLRSNAPASTGRHIARAIHGALPTASAIRGRP